MNGTVIATIWSVLGIDPTTDQTAIRRAYSTRLKTIDPEIEPAAFIELRAARDMATAQARDGAIADIPSLVDQSELFDRAVSDEAVSQGRTVDSVPPVSADARGRAGIDPDMAVIERLRALLFDLALPSPADDLAEATRAVLTDPAMAAIDHARNVEAMIADLIYRATPRSDPMLDIAIGHFKWATDEAELRRPPIVDWIVKRREDRYFEIGLPTQNGFYAHLLEELREPPPTRWARLRAWRYGSAVEFLLAYLQSFHPTALPGLDQHTLQWWQARIAAQQQGRPPGLWFRERWRRTVWERGMGSAQRHAANPLLYIGIFLFPYLFVWFLLRSKHGWTARVVGFGYASVLLLSVLIPPLIKSDPARRPAQLGSVVTAPAQAPFSDMSADIQRVLDPITADTVSVAELQRVNPPAYALVRAAWTKSKADRQPSDAFAERALAERVFAIANDVFASALRGPDRNLIIDNARSYGNRLRWAAQGSMEECADLIDGRVTGPMPASYAKYRRKLLGRALLGGPVTVEPARKKVLIPKDIVAAAQPRSRLSRADFKAGLGGRGTPAAQCNANIALIDEATSMPGPAKLDLLRNLFGGK